MKTEKDVAERSEGQTGARLPRRMHSPATKPARARVLTEKPNPPDARQANAYVLPVPGERQFTNYDCGAASLLSLMDFYGWRGNDPDPERFAKALGTNSKQGTQVEQLVREARKLNIPAEVRQLLTLQDLEKALYKGRTHQDVKHFEPGHWIGEARPVMVTYQAYPDAKGPYPSKRPWSEDWVDGHWSIVIGLDHLNVYLMDPSMNGKRGYIPHDEFMHRWHDEDDQNQKGPAGFNQLGILFSRPPSVSVNQFNTAIYGTYDYTP